MAQLQKSLVLLLGDEVQPLKDRLEEAVSHRSVEDGEPFPRQLLGILPLTNEELAGGTAQWSPTLERALNRVNDALAILQLGRERGLSVAQSISLHIVASCCAEVGRANLLEALALIHRLCRANQFLFQPNAFLLLPGLFEDREDGDPQLNRARALTTLCQVDYIMRHRAESPWDDNVPLSNIWLLDARNARGEFVGYLDEALSMIAEMVIASAAGDLEGIQQGGGKGTEDESFFSAFGYSQVQLPLATLEQQIIERFTAQVLDRQILRRQRIDSNEVLLAVKQFCNDERLTSDGILARIASNPGGSSHLTPFVAEVDVALPAAVYVEAVEQQAKAYEDNQALQGKRALHHRATEVFGELAALIDERLVELADTHPSGIFYTQAFFEELVGEGPSNTLTQGPRLDVPTNLITRQGELLGKLLEHLEIPVYRENLREIERSLANLRTDLKLRKAQFKAIEASAESQKGASHGVSLEKLREQIAALEDGIKELEEKRADVQDLLKLADQAIENIESRNALRQRVEQEWSSRVKAKADSLRESGQELQTKRQELANLLEERPHLQKRYFLQYPIALAGGIVVALLALIVSGTVSFRGIIINPETWRVPLGLAGGYFVWALWQFYKRILSQIRQIQWRITEIERSIEAGKLEFRDGYHRLYEALFIQHRDNVALSGMQVLIDNLREKLSRISDFRKRLEQWRASAAQQPTQPPDSLTRISLLKPEHYVALFELLVGEDLRRESERCLDPNFGGQRVSKLVGNGADGADSLIQALQQWGTNLAERKLHGFGLEEMLWGEPFVQLREHMRLAPEGIVRLLTSIVPSVQLQDSVGLNIKAHRAVGVPDAQSSWLRELLDQDCTVFSHRDPSRLVTFCVTSRFPVQMLSQLGFYRDAFQAVWPGRKDELGLDTAQVERFLAAYVSMREPTGDAGSNPTPERKKERSRSRG